MHYHKVCQSVEGTTNVIPVSWTSLNKGAEATLALHLTIIWYCIGEQSTITVTMPIYPTETRIVTHKDGMVVSGSKSAVHGVMR